MLSPFLYTLHTNDCTSLSPTITFLKYADNTTLLVSLQEYHKSILQFNQWHKQNHLHLNLSKAKEIFFGTHINQHPTIDNIIIETVDRFKYFGLTIHSKFSFDQHTRDIQKNDLYRHYSTCSHVLPQRLLGSTLPISLG